MFKYIIYINIISIYSKKNIIEKLIFLSKNNFNKKLNLLINK